MRRTPYLAMLILAVAFGFGAFFSQGSRPGQVPSLQCLIPRTFSAGQVIWAPAGGTPGLVPAWSVVPVRGWAEWKCGTDGYWKRYRG